MEQAASNHAAVVEPGEDARRYELERWADTDGDAAAVDEHEAVLDREG